MLLGKCTRCGGIATSWHYHKDHLTPILMCATHRKEHANALKGWRFVMYDDVVNEIETDEEEKAEWQTLSYSA